MVNLSLKDLDAISRLETGEQPLHKEYFVIQELIKEIFRTLSIKIDAKKINASIKKGCEFPITVLADKEKIRQVINNLVVNAIQVRKRKWLEL